MLSFLVRLWWHFEWKLFVTLFSWEGHCIANVSVIKRGQKCGIWHFTSEESCFLNVPERLHSVSIICGKILKKNLLCLLWWTFLVMKNAWKLSLRHQWFHKSNSARVIFSYQKSLAFNLIIYLSQRKFGYFHWNICLRWEFCFQGS